MAINTLTSPPSMRMNSGNRNISAPVDPFNQKFQFRSIRLRSVLTIRAIKFGGFNTKQQLNLRTLKSQSAGPSAPRARGCKSPDVSVPGLNK